jgi:hypothetical protein
MTKVVHHNFAEVVEAVPELRGVRHIHQLLVGRVEQNHAENKEEQTIVVISPDPFPIATFNDL